jgi:zinc-binding in reverse transcriptase
MCIEKTRLLSIISNMQLSSDLNSIFWYLDKSGIFTVHSMYKFLNSGGVHTPLVRSVWSLRIPLKFKLFLWIATHNCILTRDNLLHRGWQGPASCVFCSNNESIDHLFFTCPFAHSLWQLLFQLFP